MENESEQTYKWFYRHAETGSLYAIERSWDGHIVSSAGPFDEVIDPEDIESYKFNSVLNEWLETQNDKLILI
jgi:hypothetical protein